MVQAAFSEDSHGGALLSGSKASVLIVDDSVVARGLFSRWVSEHPRLKVAGTAADGVNGIRAADRHKPAIIILDLDMPVMDGLTALPEILKVSPSSAVIIASSLTARSSTRRSSPSWIPSTRSTAAPLAARSRSASCKGKQGTKHARREAR